MNFTYEAKATGYTVFWNGRPLGGVGIIGSYRGKGRSATAQIESYSKQAIREISRLAQGWGRRDMLDTLAQYREDEKNKRHNIFLRAYIQAALWSSTDDKDMPLDDSYRVEDISEDLISKMIVDCATFLAGADLPDDKLEQAGHDFWLTRNGHGSGFWDRPEIYGEEKAQELSALAETFGVVDLYVGDDGRIYG